MMQKSTEIKIRKPDDWHLHLRDGDALKVTVPNACRGFNRGIIMPNLVPP
ncbi:MAG: dihydroorotase, partial [Pseudomonadota bacterium]|nr:dihydroorotase [Pseudomonadota bacterium]